MKLSKNFSSDEFQCHGGCGDWKIDKKLIETLQAIRDKWGKPISIISGYRCKKYNRKVGSTDSSKHVLGMAADIGTISKNGHARVFNKGEMAEITAMIMSMYEEGELEHLGGIGWKSYKNNCLHIDTWKAKDGHLRRW